MLFLEDDTPVTQETPSAFPASETVQQLESELSHTQNRLQSMREEYETTVEELRAANEELQSTNEEYKSTLEELETSKEELQSINEELQTINQELKNKVEEVTQAHGDLQNLFVATDIATLFLDRELRIKRYTPRAAQLFNLMPPDRGRPIAHLRANLDYESLEADAQQVLKTLVPLEREVVNQEGGWFLVRVRPYRTVEDRIDGVLISFVDISTIKQTEEALRRSEGYFRSALEAMLDAALLLSPLYNNEGLTDALQWLVTQMAAMNNLQVTLQINQPCLIQDEDMRVLLFQIVRELLFNVVKHAQTDQATIALTSEGNACVIHVSDAGRGFDVAAVAAKLEKGFGLFSVRERLKLFGGDMEIQSTPGQGTQITIHAPIGADAQDNPAAPHST